MIDASRLPIVLCCAEESEVALVAVVDALHRDGFAPELLPGVEVDTSLLTTAADRLRGPALFVLCQSDDLDRFQVRRLEGLFSARRGPQHRMISVDVPRRHTTALVTAVRDAARDLGRAAGPSGDDDDGHYMRDVVTPTSVAAVPGATVPRREPRARDRGASAVVRAPEGISDEALGLSSEGDTEVVDPRDLRRGAEAPDPDALISTDPSGEGTAFDAAPGDGVPRVVPDDFPVVGESSPDVEVVPGAPRRAAWDASGPVELERVARSSRIDPRAETDLRPLPSASSPIEVGTPPPKSPEPPARRARVWLLLLASAGMASVVTMAVLHATAPVGLGAEVNERGLPGSAADGAESAVDAGAPVGPAADGAAAGLSSSTAEPAAASTSTVGGEAGSDEEPGDGETDVTGTTDAAGGEAGGDAEGGTTGTAAGDAPGDDGEPPAEPPGVPKSVPPPPTADPSRSQLTAAIEAALADGRLEALDELLVLTTDPGTITWDEAAERCKRRKLDGLRGWRLPSKAQLAKLRKAKVIKGGSYWSRSEVGGDEVYVLDAATGRMNQYLKIEPNARALCVRNRPSE